MQKTKRYIASFLLLVLGFTALPAHLLHETFADHTDAAENHCNYYHKDLGRHIEEQQNHCDIFKTNTPLYDAVGIQHNFTSFVTIVSVYKAHELSAHAFAPSLHLPARAPPTA